MGLAMTIPIGVVAGREVAERTWCPSRWRVDGILLDPPAVAEWRKLTGTSDVPRYHAATLSLRLVDKDAASYHVNISNGVPSLYVVTRDPAHASGAPLSVRFISASPFEAQSLAESGVDLIERIPMPDRLLAMVSEFVDRVRGIERKAATDWQWNELPSMGASLPAK